MKKFLFVIIFAFANQLLTAQSKDHNINQLRIAYNGDSTLLIERYEIDLLKKKVFYITPIANYLHVKGARLRTHIKISRNQWSDLKDLIYEINFNYLDSVSKKQILQPDYIIETYKSANEYMNYSIQENDIPSQIKELFKIIRK